MKINDISGLINIRNYLKNSEYNFSLTKNQVNKASDLLIAIDNKILKELFNNDFLGELNCSEKEITEEITKTKLEIASRSIKPVK